MPPVASPRPDNPRRDEILDAAVKLLREQGGKALTTSKVAKAAGMPQGHLTYYFPRRADLLVAVARRSLEVAARDVISHVQKGGGDKPADLRRAASTGLATIVKDPERTRMMLGLLMEADGDPATRKVLQQNARNLRGLLGAWMGRSPDEPEVEIALGALWGLGISHMLFSDTRGDDVTDGVLARLTQLLQSLESSRRTK